MTTAPLTGKAPASVTGPVAPAPLRVSFTLRVRIGDYEGPLSFEAESLRDLLRVVSQLPTIRQIEVVKEAQVWVELPDGRVLCPKHGVPMKKREKQGQSWYSHNVGTEDDACYCKGYPGPDSPGYDA